MKVHLKHFNGSRVGQTFLSAGSPDFPVRCGLGRLGSRPHRQAGKPALQRQRGVALVITLILLTVITFLAVAFLYLSTRERGSVATAVDQNVARLATEAATENAKAEVLSRIMASGNPNNYGLLVSTNYFNPLGFQPGLPTADVIRQSVTNVNFDYQFSGASIGPGELEKNIANLFYSPRPPVFVNTNRPAPAVQGQLDFRYWLDLNRNGRFETNGFLPELDAFGNTLPTLDTNGNTIVLSNKFVGDPEWVGLLERADRPHGPDNKFLSRWAFTVIPSGKTLDINTIHNQSKQANQAPISAGEGFSRNMGVGTWEMNLASFLVDLNTNIWQWGAGIQGYDYDLSIPTAGTAFFDALGILRYRYNAVNNVGPRSVAQVLPLGVGAFAGDLADGFGSGLPLMTTTIPPITDPDVGRTAVGWHWPGADNPNHFVTTQDLFDRNKTDAGLPRSFSDRLRDGGFGTSTYDRYTYYRMLSQLGTDSGPEPAGKLHLNYRNVDNSGNVVPNAQTNFVSWQPLEFFTNAVDQMLRANFPSATNNFQNFGVNAPLSLTNIPVYLNGRFVYTPSLHRVFQLAANIYDSSTNRLYGSTNAVMPTVFSPVFKNDGGDIYISGFEELTETWEQYSARPLRDLVTTNVAAAVQPLDRLMGVPLVIGAKKGFPNFNEYALQSVSQVIRKVALRRPSLQAKPNETNQLFIVGISNAFAVEAWNSYQADYTRPVDIFATNIMTVSFRYTNDAKLDQRGGVYPPLLLTSGGFTNVPAWRGSGLTPAQPVRQSFQIPLSTNLTLLTNSIYRMPAGGLPYWDADLNIMNLAGIDAPVRFDRTRQYPIPQFVLAITNRIVFAIVDTETRRIVDYVHFSGLGAQRDLIQDIGGGAGTTGAGETGSAGAGESKFWDRRRLGSGGITDLTQGIVNQIDESLGQPNGPAANWNDYSLQVADKNKAIDAFRIFCGLAPWKYPASSLSGMLNNLEMQTPYTPVRKVTQRISWQANDPLVHYTASDLNNPADKDQIQLLAYTDPVGALPNIGLLNDRYQPWGGNPKSGALGGTGYALELKDPGVWSSDSWNFPTNKYPAVGWLGRVHRGTPWQTVYLKSPNVDNGAWTKWTGNTNASDAVQSRPVYDRLLFDLFTTAFDENSTRGQLNVNQDGLAAWSAGLGGIIGVTNADVNLRVYPPKVVTGPSVIQPAGVFVGDPTNSPLGTIWAGINRTRNLNPFNGSFRRAADVLATPELTVASPLLNTDGLQGQKGIDDATYERLPQMLMGLLRGNDQPRFTIYAYGQTLKPANRSIVTSGNYAGMCTNYQVTAEFATRTVVRIEGAPNNPRAVVESFNVLPPD